MAEPEKTAPVAERLCHCGRPLHYTSEQAQAMMDDLAGRLGEYVRVTVDGRTWLVQRHYVALHGLVGADVASLGFEEVTTA